MFQTCDGQSGQPPKFGFIPSHSVVMLLLFDYLLFLLHFFDFHPFGNEIGQLLGMGKVSFE